MESESVKTVTVLDAHGNATRFAADGWANTDGLLTVNATADKRHSCAAFFAPGQWVSVIDDSRRAPDGMPCGEGPDARYCPRFWEQNAELEDLRAKLAEVVNPTAQDYDNAAEILSLRDQLAGIRERLALLAANLEASAAASAPSKKSQIEQGIAAKLRALLAAHLAAELLERSGQ